MRELFDFINDLDFDDDCSKQNQFKASLILTNYSRKHEKVYSKAEIVYLKSGIDSEELVDLSINAVINSLKNSEEGKNLLSKANQLANLLSETAYAGGKIDMQLTTFITSLTAATKYHEEKEIIEEKINSLNKAVDTYKAHVVSILEKEANSINKESRKIAEEKFNALNEIKNTLNNNLTPNSSLDQKKERLASSFTAFRKHEQTLNQRRDHATVTFFKAIERVFFSVASVFGIFKTEGKKTTKRMREQYQDQIKEEREAKRQRIAP